MSVKWLCDFLPPINLWSVWKMSDGYTDLMQEERMKIMRELQANAPHAEHYRKLKPEPIEIIEAWGLNFHLGNAIKYIARSSYKGTKKQDIQKAIWYLERELERNHDA